MSLVNSLDIPAQPRAVLPEDAAALGQLATEFYGAWAREDLDGLLRLWGRQSPDAAAFRQRMHQLFAAHDQIEVRSITPGEARAAGEQMKLRVTVEMSAVDAKTGRAAATRI